MRELIRYDPGNWERLKALALDSVTSPHSRRAYGSALNDFLAWFRAESRPPISKAVVNAYKAHLEAVGLSASTINVRLSAVRKLTAEAADNGLIAPELAAGIARVRGVSRHGVRLGNWLDRGQAERLIEAPECLHARGQAGSRAARGPDRVRATPIRSRAAGVQSHPAARAKMGNC